MGLSTSSSKPGYGSDGLSKNEMIQSKLANSLKTGVLNFSDMGLKSSSSAWGLLSTMNATEKIRVLDISSNALKSIPPEVTTMHNLKTFHCCGCSLQRTTSLAHLRKLVTIDFSMNDLEADQLKPLPISVTKLNLSRNHFIDIPAALLTLVNLLELDLSHNRITSTAGLGVLANLILLNLDNNLITELSRDFNGLTKLKKISLCSNKLELKSATVPDEFFIPESFLVETGVETITLTGNSNLLSGQVMDIPGMAVFLERRRKSKEKGLLTGALVSSSLFGLE